MASFKSLGILVMALICFCCNSENEVSSKENRGKKELEGAVKNYRKDGSLASEITYKNKKKHGIARGFFKNGKLQSEIYYEDDLHHGLAKLYYENGKLYRETPYNKGKIDGIRKVYRENGALLAEVPYKMDEPGLGTVEYTSAGKPKKQLPQIKVEFIDNIIKNQEYIVRVSLDGSHRKVNYYTGELTDGIYKNNQLMYMVSERGVLELKYKVPPGMFVMESLNIIAETETAMGTPYLVQKKINIAAENRGF